MFGFIWQAAQTWLLIATLISALAWKLGGYLDDTYTNALPHTTADRIGLLGALMALSGFCSTVILGLLTLITAFAS